MPRTLQSLLMAVVIYTSGIVLAEDHAVTAAPHLRTNIVLILADDLGYADVGIQGQAADVLTPQLDRLACEGVRCTAAYTTAPQCSPSRAGLLTGRYQQRFGVNDNNELPMPLEEITIPERLQEAGYACGMIGKWNLSPNHHSQAWAARHLPEARTDDQGRIVILGSIAREYFPHRQGFDQYFTGEQHQYFANFDLSGGDLKREGQSVRDTRFRVQVQTEAALAFIERNHSQPFFLYLSYFAPHVPLEATPESLERFPGTMPERRKQALAMTATMDDGVGRILESLQQHQIDERTLVIFTSDNGAPLGGLTNVPTQSANGNWNGSINDPWVGEKGMLTEGGLRVPFLLRWPGRLPVGHVDSRPVSTLDIAATAVAVAGLPPVAEHDGVDLIPYLTQQRDDDPHPALYWRFLSQGAVRAGQWKFLRVGSQAEYLFDLTSDQHERQNLIGQHPEQADRMRIQLEHWAKDLQPPGLTSESIQRSEQRWYSTHLGLGK